MNLDRSRILYERSQRVIPGGVNSNVRLSEAPHPLFLNPLQVRLSRMLMVTNTLTTYLDRDL
ncbi:MAG: hypothetical protein QF530_01610 [SAR202 cluster bacterium]|jgi:hypothetical protein|nr:hypothetical protein [SAR202 cluster bacterium]